MEALGTPLGGGALKLEAAHLRQLPVPRLSIEARAELAKIGKDLMRKAVGELARANALVLGVLCDAKDTSHLATVIQERTEALRRKRQRKAA